MLRVLLYFILKIIQIDHMRIGKILSLYLLFKHQMILLKETKKLENLNGLHLIKFHQKKKWHLIMATTLYFIRNIFPQFKVLGEAYITRSWSFFVHIKSEIVLIKFPYLPKSILIRWT